MKQAERDSKVKVSALRAQAIAGENEAEMKGKCDLRDTTGYLVLTICYRYYVCVILLSVYLIWNW